MAAQRSLRVRVALAFALMGGAVSLLLALGILWVFHDLEQRLVDETLTAELDDLIQRRERNPQSLPEVTATIRAYVLPAQGTGSVPPEVTALSPGRHPIRLRGAPFRAAVRDHGARRYVVLYNERRLLERERTFGALLVVAALTITLLSAVGAYWLAGRTIRPVTELVRRVSGTRPEDTPAPLAADFPWKEINELAADFDTYLLRLQAFIAREQAFTSDVSHELRTPLTVVEGAVEVLLADPELSQASRRRLLRIERAVHDMTAITETLLALAREELRSDEEYQEPVAVADVVREQLRRTQEVFRGHAAAVELRVEADCRVPAERAALAIVVGNLIRNAFAYTTTGAILITVTADAVTVSDTGQGISREALPRVFDRSFRAGDSAGAGIGLSLVKRICGHYGWHIGIDSRLGHGTDSTLLFRAALAGAEIYAVKSAGTGAGLTVT